MVQGKPIPENIITILQSAWKRAMKNFSEHDQCAFKPHLFLVVLTGLWEPVLLGVINYASDGIWR